MTVIDYLKAVDNNDTTSVKKYNKELCERYPFLIPRNAWSGMRITEAQNGGYWPGNPDEIPEYDWEYTIMDDMPKGWRIAFGDDLLEELREELIKYNYLDEYFPVQIKEKFGGLRWYDNGYPIGTLSEDYKEIRRAYDETIPQYDWKTQTLKQIGREHYISWYFDDVPEGMTKEDVDEYNKDSVTIYHLHDIIERCKIPEILRKYEELSYKTCIICGKPAKYITNGWISPYCEDCIKKVNDSYHPITKDDIPVWEVI